MDIAGGVYSFSRTAQFDYSMTRFVLDEAVKHLDIFPKSRDFHINVNVAASHFHQGQIITDLQHCWFPAQPIQHLTLKLTERYALPEVNHRVVHQLQRLGIDLAIDDFGTGQSSLAYLETLNPNVLKIDKSFTVAIGTDAVNSNRNGYYYCAGSAARDWFGG